MKLKYKFGKYFKNYVFLKKTWCKYKLLFLSFSARLVYVLEEKIFSTLISLVHILI